ncbi:acylneuraminate cytidylyltransferase family protein [Bdellovibrio sp. 22V]|uniref:acylneuraminate cytidylyltransferase family protein n=1 Tax=Bdellovibrio sp. 22V TaxID=3044166 RepID=UPI00254279D1|nr:acylneuraminate cytidylyltransferase family protein [Bdellovibrio sp. 22V]WII71825.1 acylneuraminate cytidylyltransferase family protein [Bdellovibrio sp. 22V]
MKNLAIIPARAGSKRVPGKNKRKFLGKPLIQWTMDAAIAVEKISRVVVTTDDIDILNMKSSYPSITFIEREGHLATDGATSVEVILDVISKIKDEFDNIILLQPTSPLRGSKDIAECLKVFYESEFEQIVSVRPCSENISHIAIESQGLLTKLTNFLPVKSPENKLVVLNGAIYISNYNYFIQKKSLFTEKTGAFEMESSISIDIDYEEDWIKAEQAGVRMLKGERP